ncbi:LON peptidase substrate-binding domain-containing protein [Vibrio brasiliensis]|uniref:LON peptidase substrate-binding domain-containing protein n=1 Tax=Vibrio brasiliensis TaxID=170652 RepID=UPI001EFDD743|nr:LON peptidase substrate-binding domain-containing protein [Vibrio brasiliensis]MCG9752768.1 LON peptidase substrate-binding domain-containing protein [Vibrio brasiliensis]MCG9780913.1 LON peptidase substrate-binding domain-containing protein [Vibrio brasiliensis]
MAEIMLFPLSSIVLPEGKMRLRIFESRYKRLVSQAMKADGTFGICLFEQPSQAGSDELSKIGTLAKVVDFESLDDGLLGITVAGVKKFEIERVRVEYDGLRYAKVNWLPNWQVSQVDEATESVARHLARVYQRFPEVGDLYEQKFLDDQSWVSQRWLEILPLSKLQFDSLAARSDCSEAITFLNQALFNSTPE